MLGDVAHPQVGVPMGGAGAPMQSWLDLWNEWEIQTVVVASFSLQVILFFLAGIRRYSVSFVLKVLLWLLYLLADVVAIYALGHMSASLSKKSSGEQQLVAFWAPFLVLHLGGQDTITAYALEDNELWRRHLLNMFLQVAGAAYVLYKYSMAGGATFVRPAVLVLATGFVKYGERISALMLASKKGSHYETPGWKEFLYRIRCYLKDFRAYPVHKLLARNMPTKRWIPWWWGWFTQNKQLRTYAFTVLTAHALRDVLVKPLIIDRNEASIVWSDTTTRLLKSHAYLGKDHESEDASAKETRHTGEMYKTIEVELGLMYDMLYTKAQVIHTWYGYCARAISLVSCFAALVIFTKTKREGYTTPNIVIKAIVSTWTCATLNGSIWGLLCEMILFARYHLLVVKDGRWSDSVGQLNLISLNARSIKRGLKGRIARLIGLRYWWDKVRCTKHPKLSPAVKKFVWGLLKGDKTHMVQIEDVAIQNGYWARKFSGFAQSEQLDWSMSCEFQKSVLIWHIATSTFLNHPDVKPELVDKDMVEAVNTLSDYIMYLIVEHPDILPIKADARSLFQQTCNKLNGHIYDDQTLDETYQIILNYKEEKHIPEKPKAYYDQTTAVPYDYPGGAVLEKAGKLARILLQMKLGITYKMVIIGTVWTEMMCYAATNASDGFHARQLSNGGEFLTHILLLTKYAAAVKTPDKTVEAGAVGHVEQTVDDGCNDEITEISLV